MSEKIIEQKQEYVFAKQLYELEKELLLSASGSIPVKVQQLINQTRNALYVAAVGDAEKVLKLRASDMQENFIDKVVIQIKSRLLLSASGLIHFEIAWSNADITAKIFSRLAGDEGYHIDFVEKDLQNDSDSDGDLQETTFHVSDAKEATHLKIWF